MHFQTDAARESMHFNQVINSIIYCPPEEALRPPNLWFSSSDLPLVSFPVFFVLAGKWQMHDIVTQWHDKLDQDNYASGYHNYDLFKITPNISKNIANISINEYHK